MARPNYSGGAQAPRKKRRGQGHVGPNGPGYQGSPGPLNSGNPYQQPKPPRKPRYGNQEQVKGGVAQRARRRAKAVGGVKGVNVKDGITGREARKIKRKWNRQGRPSPGGGGGTGGGGNRGGGGSRPPVDPFRSQVNALAQLQYGPQERELAYQRQVEAQRGVNQNDWYTQHYQRALQAAQATQAGYQAAQTQAYGQANQNFATDQNANQQLLQQQNQQAAIRGTATDPALAQQMQQGAQVRQQQQTGFGNLTGNLGANAAGYGQTRALQASERGIQAGQDTQARQRKVESLARELLADKGAFKVKARGELQEAQHKSALEDAAFGLDVTQEENDQKNEDRDARLAARKARKDAARTRLLNKSTRQDIKKKKGEIALDRNADLADDGRRNYSTDYDEWTQKGGGGDKGGDSGGGKGPSSFTPTQVRSGRKSLRNLVGRVKNNVDPPDSVDPLLAQAAVQLADKGGVTPALARKIKRQYGFTPKIRNAAQRAGDEAGSWF